LDLFQAIRARRSIRRFKAGERVEPGHLEAMLEAARLAPSAKNLQPWFFVVVRDPDRKRALARAARKQWFLADADVVIVGLSDPRRSPRWHDKDIMIALEHMVLAATALGYGSCWIGALDKEEVKRIVRAPEELEVVALLAIGVPDEEPPPRPRKPLEEFVFSEEYGRPWHPRGPAL